MLVTADKSQIADSNVTQILESRHSLEDIPTANPPRRNLTLGDKLKLLHFLNKDNIINQECQKYRISRITARHIMKSRYNIGLMDAFGNQVCSTRPLKALSSRIYSFSSRTVLSCKPESHKTSG